MQAASIRAPPRLSSELVLGEIERFKPFTEFLYADEAVYTFHSGIPMPPQLAATSLKRMWSGDMTNARLAAELREPQPGVECNATPWIQNSTRPASRRDARL